jgi:hypothetical protein
MNRTEIIQWDDSDERVRRRLIRNQRKKLITELKTEVTGHDIIIRKSHIVEIASCINSEPVRIQSLDDRTVVSEERTSGLHNVFYFDNISIRILIMSLWIILMILRF